MKRIIFLLFFMGIVYSCEKEYYTTIPDYPVNLSLNLNGGNDYVLNTRLAYEIITQPRLALDKLGFGGILLINGMGDYAINLFAYDLACPVEAQRNIRVVPDNFSSSTAAVATAITATCPKCGAVFNIASGNGAPQSGTKYYLKSYRIFGSEPQYTVTN